MNSAPSLVRRGLSADELARAIFKAEIPESIVRSLPAQSAYMAIKATGVESAGDIISMLTKEQYQVSLDFELWEKDDFNEDGFWEWLAAIDEQESLAPLQQLLNAIDLKLIALIISTHVQTVIFDDQTDNPPGPLYFTPDNGFTWIFLSVENPDRHRLLGKLLAYIFESSAELFYQLISVQGVSTLTDLEESSYQDRCRRLSEEGIPDPEFAFKLHAPLTIGEIRNEISNEIGKAKVSEALEHIPVVEPLIFAGTNFDRFLNLTERLQTQGQEREKEELEGELSLIMNSAILRFGVKFSEINEVTKLVAQVKGAINIGLELIEKENGLDFVEVYRSIGLQKIYRLGLGSILGLGRIAHRLSREVLEDIITDAPLFLIVSGARLPFPECPISLADDGSFQSEDGKLISGFRPYTKTSEIRIATELISKRFSN